jgi:hypothetical protein
VRRIHDEAVFKKARDESDVVVQATGLGRENIHGVGIEKISNERRLL